MAPTKCPKCGVVAEHKKILVKKEVCADCITYIGKRCKKCGYECKTDILEESNSPETNKK
ncbi:MAG: hypothetical protein QXO71_06930 [Candidatus Jordarchaeaceae archaeon]